MERCYFASIYQLPSRNILFPRGVSSVILGTRVRPVLEFYVHHMHLVHFEARPWRSSQPTFDLAPLWRSMLTEVLDMLPVNASYSLKGLLSRFSDLVLLLAS